jgi:hypothetical protein
MRTFIADEPFQPVERQHPEPPGSTSLTLRQQKLGLLLIGVVLIGIGIYIAILFDDPEKLTHSLAFCSVGALALYISRIPWSEAGRPKMSDAGSRLVLGGASLVLLIMAAQSVANYGLFGGVWIELAALGCTALWVYQEASAYQDRKIAKLMHESAVSALAAPVVPAAVPIGAATPSAAAPSADPIRPTPCTPDDLARRAPAIRLDIYLQDELPELPGRYLTPVASDINIIGLPPRRILYLYNFFSTDALVHKVKGNWRRFGPVYLLGSPGDFRFGHAFDRRIATQVQTAILPTPESFDARLKGATDAVLPPGDDNLKGGVSHFSGGYPHHLFLCNDGSWRHAVDKLLDHVEFVMIDACGYDAQRAGLNWEIGQLLDRKPLRNIVVLIDVDTDQTALCTAFRTAWHSMADTSPNNITDPGPVRWVLLESHEERQARSKVPFDLPPEADPHGLYPKCNPVIRRLMAGNYRSALLEDRIFGLFARA